jgi:hypothetical protein
VVEPFGIAGLAADIAAVIEHGKGVAVLQGASAPLLQGGANCDGELRSRRFVDRMAVR